MNYMHKLLKWRESGQRKDELEDAQLSVEDLKAQIRELNIELDESRVSLSKGKTNGCIVRSNFHRSRR